MKNERLPRPSLRRRLVQSPIRGAQTGRRERAGEAQAAVCAARDCGKPISFGSTAVRFRHGFVKSNEEGDEFIQDQFEDGLRAKYVHADCADSAEARPHELRPAWCVLCDHQFFVQESAIYADSGVLIEHTKLAIPVFHIEASGGCVHWACAWNGWDWDLFRGFLNDGTEENRR
jgi:hypothetical protein